MLKTSESVEKSAEYREGLAEEIRAVGMCGDGSGDRVMVPRATLAVWARRVEECEWGDGVIRAPRDRNDMPLLLGDHVRVVGTTDHGVVRRISHGVDDGSMHCFLEVNGPSGAAFYAPSDLEHAPATPSARIREWVRRARADEHMDLRELDAIADELDAEVAE